jgi:membrane dipeptidase
VTHLSDTSFFEAVDGFDGPMLASHQACRSLVPAQRQFSDEQLKIVIDRGGVICIPCDAWMLYPNFIRGETTREVLHIDVLADHVDYICQLAGDSQHVGIGSDLDGGYGTEQTPLGLDSIADLQKLVGILDKRGYSMADIDSAMGENLLRFFTEHLPA